MSDHGETKVGLTTNEPRLGGNAGFASSVFNLMNAILGSGIVALPYPILVKITSNNLNYLDQI